MTPYTTPPRSENRCGAVPLSTFLIAILVCGALAACSGSESADSSRKSTATVPVVVASALQKDMPLTVEAIGNVEAIASVAVKSRVDGQIVKLGFHDGAEVALGQMLFEIDARPVLAQMKQAQAKLASDVAQYEHAKDQDARYQDLLQKKFISPDAYNQIKANLDSAQANVDADKAALENARLQVEYSTLRAPIAGRAGRIMVQQGNLVKANDTVALATINQISPIFVSFSVPERYLPLIRGAMKAAGGGQVDVIANGDGGRETHTEGKLSFVDNSVDMTTGTIRLRATIANKEALLWPGQFVRAVLTLGLQKSAIVVSSDAVQIGPKGNYVYVVDAAKKAQLRDVEVERVAGRETVLAKGLKSGEKIVIDGQSRLVPGIPVEIHTAGPSS